LLVAEGLTGRVLGSLSTVPAVNTQPLLTRPPALPLSLAATQVKKSATKKTPKPASAKKTPAKKATPKSAAKKATPKSAKKA
jgi:hypothetical protein